MEKNTYFYGTTTERAALFSAVAVAQGMLERGEAATHAQALSAASLNVLHVPEQGALTTVLAHEGGGHVETRYIYRDGETAQSAKDFVISVLLGVGKAKDAPSKSSPASANEPTMGKPPGEPPAAQAQAPAANAEGPTKTMITDPSLPEVQEGKLRISGATLGKLAVIEEFAPTKYAGAALTALQAEIAAARARLQPKAA